MTRPTHRPTSARLRFGVFLLLAIAVVATEAQPPSLGGASDTAADVAPSAAPLRGPLFRHVIDAGRHVGKLSWTAVSGLAGG